jgi:gliding motility-associated-like protein
MKLKLLITVIIANLFVISSTKAQTLSAGDIAIIGVNEDAGPVAGEDHSFTWIALTDIPAGEVIYFTEEGVNINSMTWYANGESHYSWTAPGGGLSCGSIVHVYEDGAASEVLVALGGGVMSSILVGGTWNLLGGDQVLVYQAAAAQSSIASTTFITGIHLNEDYNEGETNGWTSTTYDGNPNSSCHLPPGLTDGVNCISLYSTAGASPERDNNKYIGTLTGDAATLRALINSPFTSGNWSGDNGPATVGISVGDYSPSVTCAAACTDPDVPTVTPSSATACSGASITLTISGSLYDATAWKVYTGSCGGTLVGTTSSSIVLTPSATTTYYVRGEGGCVAAGSCGTTTVTISANTAVTTQPTSQSACDGGNATFTAAGSGTGTVTYQWQDNSGGGSLANISGATGATLNIVGVVAPMNARQYRCVIGSDCGTDVNSNTVSLTVTDNSTVTNQPINQSTCDGGNASFTAAGSGTGTVTYQWQDNTGLSPGTFANIPAQTNSSLNIAGVTTHMNGRQYRCVIGSDCGTDVNSNTVSLTVTDNSTVTTQPTSQSTCDGGNASFTAAGSGTGTVTYQWQDNTGLSPGTFANIPAQTNSSLNIAGVTTHMNGRQYRCVIGSDCGTDVNSNTVSLTVTDNSTVTNQPTNQTACDGGNASFTAAGSGTGTLTYQWQDNSGGGSLANISGATGATLNIVGVVAPMNARQYRCVIGSDCGTDVNSNTVSLTVTDNSTVTNQPTNQTACDGGNASFTAAGSGTGTLTYQWQDNSGGGSLANISGATGATLNIVGVVAPMNARQYRCVIGSDCGTDVNSNTVSLTVTDNSTVTNQPTNQTACDGGNASFTAAGSGTGTLTYQWQDNSGGGSLANISGATGATLNIVGVVAPMNARQYRCVIGSDCGTDVNSNTVSLTVTDNSTVTNQPTNQTACDGGNASFTAAGSGTGTLTYQWQDNSGGGSLANISGATGATLNIVGVVAPMNARQYRCVIGSDCGTDVNSNTVSLTVTDNSTVTNQPTNQTACDGGNASFTAAGSGTGTLTYQWQDNSGGGSLANISGATGATLNIVGVVAPMNARQYRCVIGSDCGTDVNSNTVSLTVTDNSTVTNQPTNQSACDGGNASFTTTGTGTGTLTYQWQDNSGGGSLANISGATGATLNIVGVVASMNARQYRCMVSSSCGSAASTNTVSLTVTDNSTVTNQPTNQSACDGGNASFTIAGAGAGTVTYQWQDNTGTAEAFVNIGTETSATLNLVGVSTVMNGRQYQCIVSSDCGSVTSSAVILTVEDNIAPTVVLKNITTILDASGNVTVNASALDSASADNCGISSYEFVTSVGAEFGKSGGATSKTYTCSDLGGQSVTIRVIDGSGNSATGSAIITVIDQTAPIVVLKSITAALDASGNVTVNASALDSVSSDNCGISSYEFVTGNGAEFGKSGGATSNTYTCSDLGNQSVTVRVIDGSGNSATGSVIITVIDQTAPILVLKNITAALDASGNVIVNASALDSVSSDNCGISSYEFVTGNGAEFGKSGGATSNTYTCSDLGSQSVTVRVIDGSGNSATGSVIITVIDQTAPTVVLKNITANLSSAGSVVVAASAFDSLSSDACGSLSFAFNNVVSGPGDTNKTFGCEHIGDNTVWLKISDSNGNSGVQGVVVTIADQSAPLVILKNITVKLNAAGNVIVPASVLDSASSDACSDTLTYEYVTTLEGMPGKPASETSRTFTCLNVGLNSVQVRVFDEQGNSTIGNATITVVDETVPTVVLKNISAVLSSDGTVTVAASSFDSLSTDACGISNFQFVTSAGVSFGKAIGNTSKTFTCSDIGTNSIQIVAIDASGNRSSSSATITIADETSPTLVLKNITATLSNAGSVVLAASAFDSLSSDACGISNFQFVTSVSSTFGKVGGSNTSKTFTCSDLGTNSIQIVATDASGNSNISSAALTIVDLTPPTVVLKNITANLNSAGEVVVAASSFDSLSSDACGIYNFQYFTIPPGISFGKGVGNTSKTYTCSDIGTNSIQIVATDASGNSNISSATLTIVDVTTPTVVLKNITATLSNTGSVVVAASAFDSLSSDACGISNFQFVTSAVLYFGKAIGNTSKTYTCSDIGTNTVQIVAIDASGNSSSSSATITIVDVTAPIILLKDITAYLSSAGNVVVAASAFDSLSSDACGISNFQFVTSAGMSFGKGAGNTSKTFTCSDLGINTVQIVATDASGNSISAYATITILDETSPNIVLKDISAVLSSDGTVTVAASSFDSLSTDACGINNFVFQSEILERGEAIGVSKTFTCDEVGENEVVIVVSDYSGNISSQRANITILDYTAPLVSLKNISVDLDENGEVVVKASDLDSLSTDVCGILEFNFVDIILNGAKSDGPVDSVKVFTCGEVGINQVQIKVTDVNGNSAYGTVTVTVTDVTAPVVALMDITVALDSLGEVIVKASDLDSASSDACGDLTYSFAQEASQEGFGKIGGTSTLKFYCNNLGENIVNVFVRDVNGQVSYGTAAIIVIDDIAPKPVLKNLTVSLDSTGFVTVNSGNVNRKSSDNCSLVAVTFTDRSGDRGVIETSNLTFDCSQVGENVVGVTITDQSGNQSFEDVTITVVDETTPVVYLKNITKFLNVDGSLTINASELDSASFDACGIERFTIQIEQGGEVNRVGADSVITFTCDNVGENRVIIGVYDVNGNVNSAVATITIQDLTRPSVSLKDISVALDVNGNATVLASNLDSASYDACGILGFYFGGNNETSASRDGGNTELTFDCNAVGKNEVVVEVVDVNGNRSNGTVTITIIDNIAPVVLLKSNILVNLDVLGQATVLASDLDSASHDACGIASFTFIQTTASGIEKVNLSDTTMLFSCNAVGVNNVYVIVTDVNGNQSIRGTTITVIDDISPVAVLKNITAELGTDGRVAVHANAFDNGSSDACGIASFRFGKNAQPKSGSGADSIRVFECFQIGINDINIVIEDVNGNISIEEITVTVVDVIKPTALAKNITVYLDENGERKLSPEDVDNLSFDNCSIKTMSVFPNFFSCEDTKLTSTPVTLTVEDSSGNISTAIANVIVMDSISQVDALVQGNDVCESLDIQLIGSQAVSHIWTGPNNYASNQQSPVLSEVSVLNAGMYYLQVVSDNGCTLRDSVNVLVRPNPVITLNHLADVSCYEKGDGVIDLTITNGSGFSYLWNNQTTNEDLVGIGQGIYQISVSNTEGCATISDEFEIMEPESLYLATELTEVSCSGVMDGSIVAAVTGGNGDNEYTWTKNGAYFSSDLSVSQLGAGTYKLLVTDSNGCAIDATRVLTQPEVLWIALYAPALYLDYEVSGFGLSDGSIETEITGGNGGYEIMWSNGSTEASLNNIPAGEYTIAVTDSLGCEGTENIKLNQPIDLLFATALSPNGDGFNDYFVIKGVEALIGNQLLIIDQFGTIVLQTANYKNKWKGQNLGGEDLPEGTYFYVFTRPEGNENSGYITLKR